MKGIIFDLEGEFAHFRKFYTNSSSLSYTVPPRTTIMGLIAGILGEERDSYYEKFHSSSLCLAVRKNGATRMLSQTLNYIKATSSGELVSPSLHTQIPFEIVRGKEGKVSYRIYAVSEDKALITTLERHLSEEYYVYPPSMGTAFFHADVIYQGTENFEWYPDSANTVYVESILPVNQVKTLEFTENRIIREKMPRDFLNEREMSGAEPYLVEENGNGIEAVLKEGYYLGENTNSRIVFM